MILGIPFIRINGESLLRFDIPSLRLHAFGRSLWMDEFLIVLAAIMFISFLIITVTLLFGRIWCGWLCPQTVIIDITWFLDRAKGIVQKTASYILVMLLSIIVAASLIWYFISPYDFIPDLVNGSLGRVTWWFWISLTVIIFLNYAFLRHAWCATACPYSKLQGALFDSKTLILAFDKSRENECMDCRACVKVCPVKIDIRNGLNAACISCAECRDACISRMESRQRNGLIGYFFGSTKDRKNLIRPNAVIISTVTLLFLIYFLYLAMTRNPFDLTVVPNYDIKPAITSQGELLNSFSVAAENKSRDDIEYTAAATVEGRPLRIMPEKFLLKAGEYRRMPVYIFLKPNDMGTAELLFETSGPRPQKIARRVTIMQPMASR